MIRYNMNIDLDKIFWSKKGFITIFILATIGMGTVVSHVVSWLSNI